VKKNEIGKLFLANRICTNIFFKKMKHETFLKNEKPKKFLKKMKTKKVFQKNEICTNIFFKKMKS
jgi:hypothetical protein